MIKGRPQNEYNDFEIEIEALLGDTCSGYGAIHYFNSLNDTFTRAKESLEDQAKNFHKEIQDEDIDVKRSLLGSKESTAYPLLTTLYESYFITLHSELERIWYRIIQEYNKFHKIITYKKLNSNYILKPSRCFIDESVIQHKILLTYNYVRNGIIHAKNTKDSQGFRDLEIFMKSGELLDLEIIENKNGFILSINSLGFGKKFASEIINLMQSIITLSIKERHGAYERL